MSRLHHAIAIAFAFAASAQAEVLTLHGKVLVRSSVDGHAVIAQVDPSDSTGDARHYFALQVESPPTINMAFASASITFAPGEVTITAPDEKERITLSMCETARPAAADAIRFCGVGLAHITQASANVFEGDWSVAAGGCDSGGAGATSCSVSGGTSRSSVSCTAGFYACCDGRSDFGAKCKRVSAPPAPPPSLSSTR